MKFFSEKNPIICLRDKILLTKLKRLPHKMMLTNDQMGMILMHREQTMNYQYRWCICNR